MGAKVWLGLGGIDTLLNLLYYPTAPPWIGDHNLDLAPAHFVTSKPLQTTLQVRRYKASDSRTVMRSLKLWPSLRP
jgi:hypothetical protein